MENGKNMKQVSKKVVMSKFGKMDLNKFITGDDSYWELRMSVDYVHSKIYEKNPLKDQMHMSMSMLPRVYNCKKILILGVGGAGQCLQLLRMGFQHQITAVDIDPIMLNLARKFLGENEKNLELIEKDAKEFLFSTDEIYDCIIVDLFCDGSIPEFVLKNDFYKLVCQRLSKTGILTVNTGLPGKPYQYGIYQQDPLFQVTEMIRQAGFPTIMYQDIFECAVIYAFRQPISSRQYQKTLLDAWHYYEEANIRCSVGTLILMTVFVPAKQEVSLDREIKEMMTERNMRYRLCLAKKLLKEAKSRSMDPLCFVDLNIKNFIKRNKLDVDTDGLKMTYYEEILEAVRHKAILTCEEVAKFIVISDYKPMVKRDLTPTQEKLQNIWMAIVLAKEDRSFEAVEFIEKVVDKMD